MKLEQIIGQYLYNNKQVSLQGIGTIKLNPSVSLPTESDKDFVMPDNAFAFEYNLKAPEDEGLIIYIVQQTKKIKPLAAADLESFLSLSKQFLNIGKPFLLEGVGTIQKNQQGDYEFIAGQFISPKIDDIPKQLREKRDESVSFESERKTNNNSRNLILGVSAISIFLVGMVIYYFVTNNNDTKSTTPITITDTTQKDTAKIDTTHHPLLVADSNLLAHKDSSTFKIVIKEFNNQIETQKAFDKLTAYGHKLVMITVDSTKYQLAIPFTSALSDTLRAKDSLKRFFGGSPFVK